MQGLFFISPDKQNNVTQKLKNELLYINQLSEQYNVSIQKMALNYCLQQPYIDNILIGVDNVNQLKQNLLDGDCSLSSKNIDDINSIIVNDVDLLNPSLWNQ